ncbi:MAG: dihydrofolate reductase [Micavibrio aeruginosavorus]|uniref:Dihydrofolate reductase n=1 Tax=Micavibrio aeruginosavorus TaxID=349221 RepID=A0A7T5R389_9BACT|nr:MAG: dihydrofolate reductase [Micavibrio aeruginosavorus]
MGVRVSAIAAMSTNFVIGKDNKMLWHIPEDFKHFKRTTMGKPLVMGRKTFESIGGKALPGRPHVVISRSPQQPVENVQFATSVEDALKAAKGIAESDGVDEIFIAGGAQIYDAAMPYIERIYLTIVNRKYEGDSFFPRINGAEWREEIIASAEEPVPYIIGILDRKS